MFFAHDGNIILWERGTRIVGAAVSFLLKSVPSQPCRSEVTR